jgi:elongation factor P
MQVAANTLRAGHVFEHEGKLWVVIRSEIMIPGKGNAIVQIDMRDARTGTKSNIRFRTQETIEKVFVEDSDMQYLFGDDVNYTFMDQTSYEQIMIPSEVLGDKAKYLTENMVCKVRVYEGNALSVELPQTVILEVAEADPYVKGQTAQASYKPAKLANGLRVMVPPFIEAGEKIVVNTDDNSYIERAKG